MTRQVLHILGSAQPEGTGTAQIVRSLPHERYAIHALFLAGSGPLVGMLQQAGIKAQAIDWQRGLSDPFGALRFTRILRQCPYDIIHIHFGGRAVLRLASAATSAKIIRHLHGRILEPQGLAPVQFEFKNVDAVVAVSKAVAAQVMNSNVQVIYAGVKVPPVVPPRPTNAHLTVGTAARLVRLKGIHLLLDTIARLQHDFPSLELEIAGSGPEQKALKELATQLGIGDRVRFLGWIDDLAPVLGRWDIFAMPSLEEGFPIAALNAMAAGIPVVASRVGGIGELIRDGANGVLIEPNNPGQLSAALQQLLQHPETRERIGNAGYAHIRDHFSVEQMTTSATKLYDKLLHPERSNP